MVSRLRNARQLSTSALFADPRVANQYLIKGQLRNANHRWQVLAGGEGFTREYEIRCETWNTIVHATIYLSSNYLPPKPYVLIPNPYA